MSDLPRIVLGLDKISFQDYFAMSRAFVTNDLETAYRLAQSMITEWDYKVSLDKPEALFDLGVKEGALVMNTIMNSTAPLMETISTEGVVLDFTAWNTRRFLLLNRLRAENKIDEYEPMLHEIAVMEETAPDKPLTLRQGFSILRAVNEKYEQYLTGKN